MSSRSISRVRSSLAGAGAVSANTLGYMMSLARILVDWKTYKGTRSDQETKVVPYPSRQNSTRGNGEFSVVFLLANLLFRSKVQKTWVHRLESSHPSSIY